MPVNQRKKIIAKKSNRKVLVIGWDAADWNIINPLIEKGLMPTFAEFIKNGVSGKVATLEPPFSPMLWTSVATGKTPDKHGILGFVEPHPEEMSVRPVNGTSRKVKALWNILHHKGYKSNVVGWWPSHPAEPINGVMVSNFFAKQTGTMRKPIKIQKGMIHPESMAEEMSDLRMFPDEVNAAHILPFMPKAADIDQKKSKVLTSFSKIFSQSVSIHAASTYLAEKTDWDFMAVYFDFIDHICHGFMRYHPPKMKGVDEEKYEIFKDVVTSAYRFQDMMLEHLLRLAGEDTTVIILSDHGFKNQSDRISSLPKKFPAAPALDHAPFGVIAMKGPGIKNDGTKIFGSSLLDLTPTILTMFDLPVGRDMDGKVLVDCFDTEPEITYIDSWEEMEGDFGNHEKYQEDTLSSNEAMEQLIELGYVEKGDEDKSMQVEKTKDNLKYNLARVYHGKKQYNEAERLFRELSQKEPDALHNHIELISIYLTQNKFDLARKHFDILRKIKDSSYINTELIEAKILLGEGKAELALPILEKLEKKNLNSAGSFFEIGKSYMQMQHFSKAEELFKRARQWNPDSATIYQALAVSLLRQDKVDDAIDAALTSVQLVRNFAEAHYTLGEALERGGHKEEAKTAYEMALRLNKKKQRAAKAIEKIEAEELFPTKNGANYIHHEDEIIAVSGLPRSGTSMMMQMLEAGGVEVYSDNVRKADKHNPKGYYEVEAVKSLKKDNSMIDLTKGKAVKVIAQLLQYLPPRNYYKVIFMHRDLNEVMHSQQVMLGKNPENYNIGLVNSYRNQIKTLTIWEKKEPGVQILHLKYTDVLENPLSAARSIAEFLNKDLDLDKMAKVIDPALYRSKIEKVGE